MDESCLAAESLAGSWYMKFILSAKIGTCLTGMVLLIWMYKKYGIHWLGHVNAKWIFGAHLASTFFTAASFFTVYVVDLIRLSISRENPCDYLIPIKISFLLRVPCQIFIYLQVLTMFSLSIERLTAVRHPTSYEQTTRPTVAIFSIILSVLFSIIFVTGMFVPGVDFSKSWAGFVTKTRENAVRFYIVIVFQLLPEVLTLLVFNFVRQKSRVCSARDLNTRYQVEENRKVCHHLIPVFYCHALVLMCSATGISLIPLLQYQSFFGLNDLTYALALETTGWALLYSALMPITVHIRTVYRHKNIVKKTQLGSQNYFIDVGAAPCAVTDISLHVFRNRVENKYF